MVVNIVHTAWKSICIMSLIISVAIIFMPLNPIMPDIGLDLSWMMVINELAAKGVSFGKEAIFTFGPYGALYTGAYHPVIDKLMIYSSAFLSVAYLFGFILLINRSYFHWLIIIGLILVCQIKGDMLFLAYPLVVGMLVYRVLLPKNNINKLELSPIAALLLFVFFFSVFGLLSLIKLSYCLFCLLVSLICASLFFINKNKILSVITMTVPIISLLILWAMMGQKIMDLPAYFQNGYQIIAGYSEGMALTGHALEIVIYLIACLSMLTVIIIQPLPIKNKSHLILLISLYLFISFKEGFVRHDGHAIYGASGLMIAAILLLPMSIKETPKKALICVALVMLMGIWIDKQYPRLINFPWENHFALIKDKYMTAYKGIIERMTNPGALKERYYSNLDMINKRYPIEQLNGTADIYTNNQAWLLASGNHYHPRPVFQSYSAYLPALSRINLEHLNSSHAPDYIIFGIEPLDNRLPSLDDGPSWPILINKYRIYKYDPVLDLVYLSKKSPVNTYQLDKKIIYQKRVKLGDKVILPQTNKPLFAEIKLSPTMLGRIAKILFKPSQLTISVELLNGQQVKYRAISGMLTAGFIISPLVQNTHDFIALLDSRKFQKKEHSVKSIYLSTSKHFHFLWKNTYEITLYELNEQQYS